MSRIGRMPVPIPGGVDVTINGREVTVTGPKGKLSLEVAEPIEVSQVVHPVEVPVETTGGAVA